MTMNIPMPNSENGHRPPPDVPLPSAGDSTMFNPSAVEAIAYQLYTALPRENSVTTAPVNPNLSATEAKGRLPSSESYGSDMSGVVAIANSSPNHHLSEEALTEIAKQLSAQMLPTNLEASLKQAFAQLDPVPSSQETDRAFPTAAAPSEAFYFLSPPTVGNLGLESGAPFDVNAIRKDFPILHQRVHGKPLIWMDNAATTQKPQSVIDALSRYYQHDNSNIHRAAHTLAARATDAYEGAREKVQRFLGASSASEIIFVRGTTEAINLVAQTYGRKYIRAGDEIILSTLEHHANIVPWQMLAQETGAIIKVIPVSDQGEILLEEYARLLGPQTRIVGITQVSNALGTILPVQEMTQMAHRHGAIVLIDGAQAVSHLPVNVQELGCDFYTISGHKLFAPTGIGALYAKREILEDLPPWQGGGSMIRSVTFEKTTYSEPPAKFEAGTPNIADAVGLGAAIDYITRLGMFNIEQYEHKLTCYATERLAQIPGLHQIGTAPHKVSVLSFILDDIPVEEVGKRLAQEGIAVRAGHHCAQPTMQRYGLTGTVRPSLAFYNTCEEIDALIEVLRTIRWR